MSFTGTLFRGYGNLKNNRNREERETEHRRDNAISYFNIFFLTFWLFKNFFCVFLLNIFMEPKLRAGVKSLSIVPRLKGG